MPLLLSIVMVDFFDTLGTVTAVAETGGLDDANGRIPRLRAILGIDAVSASIGGLLGASSVTSYIESAAGVADGARTGLHSVFVALFFGACVFSAPVMAMVPAAATAPALIMVGFLMCEQVGRIDFTALDTAIPAFIILLTLPLTYSISHGIGFGFIAFVAIKFARGRAADVHPVMFGSALSHSSRSSPSRKPSPAHRRSGVRIPRMRTVAIALVSALGLAVTLAAQRTTPTAEARGAHSAAVHGRRGHHPRHAARAARGRTTSRALVMESLTRIAIYDRILHAVMIVNPKALDEADRLDRERKEGGCAGRSMGFPSRSRTTSTRPTCPRPAARWPSRVRPPVPGDVDDAVARGGSHHHREDRDDRAGQLGRRQPDADAGQLQRRGWLRHEPVRPAPRPARGDGRRASRADHGRLELRDRHGRELLGGQRRQRDVGLDPQPEQPEHAGRDQADGRAHQPLRHHPHHGRPGHGGADGAHGHRRGHHAGRARGRGAGSARSRDDRLHAAAWARLHEGV